MQASMPIRWLDAPATGGSGHRDAGDVGELLGDSLDAQLVEGAQEEDAPLAACLESERACDVLQHDIDVVLFTLPARERNVRAAALSSAVPLTDTNCCHSKHISALLGLPAEGGARCLQ